MQGIAMIMSIRSSNSGIFYGAKKKRKANTTKIKLVGRVLPTIATKVRSSASNFKVCNHFRLDLKTNKQASSHPQKKFLFSSFFFMYRVSSVQI
jgi:hypothetical protein